MHENCNYYWNADPVTYPLQEGVRRIGKCGESWLVECNKDLDCNPDGTL